MLCVKSSCLQITKRFLQYEGTEVRPKNYKLLKGEQSWGQDKKNNAYMQKNRAKTNSELDVVNKRDNLEVCIRIEYQRNDYCLSN